MANFFVKTLKIQIKNPDIEYVWILYLYELVYTSYDSYNYQMLI